MQKETKEFLARLAANIAQQFGRNCEVAIHEFRSEDLVISHIENGYITGRRVGDISNNEFFEEFSEKDFTRNPVYHLQTKDGRKLLSSTTYLESEGHFTGFICINYDISEMSAAVKALDFAVDRPEAGVNSDVNEILEQNLRACEALIGKSPDEMSREDKYRAVEYLEKKHVFLITKSSSRVCSYLKITKYGLYTFLDDIRKKNSSGTPEDEQ